MTISVRERCSCFLSLCQEIEDTQRQIIALAQRLHALHERRFRLVNSSETERL